MGDGMSQLQMIWIGIYVVMNMIGYGIMAADKKRATHHLRRVPEKTLFLWAAAGGALGSQIAMRQKRHKTKHMSFVIGMPLLLIVNVVLYGYLVINMR